MTDKEIEAQCKLVSMMARLQEQAELEDWDDGKEKYEDDKCPLEPDEAPFHSWKCLECENLNCPHNH